MGEQYQNWLNDPTNFKILQSYGANGLQEPQQSYLEKYVAKGQIPASAHNNQRLKQLLESTRKTHSELRDLVCTLHNRCKPFPSGFDPHVIQGESHRRGADQDGNFCRDVY